MKMFIGRKRGNSRPRVIWAMLLPVVLSGCNSSVPPATVQSVSVGTVDSIVSDGGQKFSASISPNAQVQLVFKSGGIVQSIHQVRGADGRMRNIGTGDPVAKGQLLAQVRVTEYDSRLTQANAELQQSEAQLASAKANQLQATLSYNRAKNLFESSSLVKPEFDRAQAGYDAANAQVQQVNAAISAARAAIAQAQVAYGDTAVRAPFQGVVAERNIELGSLVGGNAPAFTVIDTHVVKAIFAVPDISLATVHLGQKIQVSLDALLEPVTGTVTAISPAADPRSRVFSVEVTIANPKELVRPGMIGSLTLGGENVKQAHLVVPLGSVIKSPHHQEGFAVFLLSESNGKTYVKAQDVQLGKTLGNSMEVLNGLSAGQRIVVFGSQLVREGQEVRVVQ
jgi:RND family efflux transporter MFP subunit